VQQELKRSCAKERNESKSGVSKFWIVKSADEVLARIESVNLRNVARNVGSIDFTTLYTGIDQDSIVKELRWVVRKAFRDSGKKRIAVYKERAKWVDIPKEGTKSGEEGELLEMIEYLIRNIAFEYGETVDRHPDGNRLCPLPGQSVPVCTGVQMDREDGGREKE